MCSTSGPSHNFDETLNGPSVLFIVDRLYESSMCVLVAEDVSYICAPPQGPSSPSKKMNTKKKLRILRMLRECLGIHILARSLLIAYLISLKNTLILSKCVSIVHTYNFTIYDYIHLLFY